VDRHNLMAVTLVFRLLALGFIFAGHWRLHRLPGLHEVFVTSLLTASILINATGWVWVKRLHRYAYKHRQGRYERGA
jgi:hypothetical protein